MVKGLIGIQPAHIEHITTYVHVITHICGSCLYIQDGKTPLDMAKDNQKYGQLWIDVVEYLQQQLGKCTCIISTLYEF